ncbi:lipoxygenase [Coniochaeta sp. 2T2.1]|nr:lipoxygenase [Coniochaeta sp. 2T2.1]
MMRFLQVLSLLEVASAAVSNLPFSIATHHDEARAREIALKRRTFIYGPPVFGSVVPFPAGELGNATYQADTVFLNQSIVNAQAAVMLDTKAAVATITEHGPFRDLADFSLLYEGQWKNSIPLGLLPGMLSNSTSDLSFSMERLSLNPAQIRRLHQFKDSLPFLVDDTITKNITGLTLTGLHQAGRLFYLDNRSQAKLETQRGRFAPACDAYFYMDPRSDDFLPLAVRPNIGSDLIYTPLDSDNDWLLAKMMLNLNELAVAAQYHYAAAHEVISGLQQAAIRSMSDQHPVLPVVNRVSRGVLSMSALDATAVLGPTGLFSEVFPYTPEAAAQFQVDLYNRGAGEFRANYLHNNLRSRGLFECNFGPELKRFPFLEDAAVILDALRDFFRVFVHSYYSGDQDVALDGELQQWAKEAAVAKVTDFPPSLDSRSVLVDVLTHMAYLAGILHHVLNTNNLANSAVLPTHPGSFYAPLPTSKGVSNLLPLLPSPEQAVASIAGAALFSRQSFRGTNMTLKHMFDDTTLLARTNNETTCAAQQFQDMMGLFSEVVRNRTFDEYGLSLGMPILWKAMDPDLIPSFLAV